MRINSHGRLSRIQYALAELRYGSTQYSNLSDIDYHYPGDSLDSLQALSATSPRMHRTYTRLLKQDATLANEGKHFVSLYVKRAASNADEWFDTATVAQHNSPDFPSADWTSYLMDDRNVVLTWGNEEAELRTAFPGLEFRVTQPRPRSRYDYGRIEFRFDRSLLGEVPSNLEEYLTNAQWQSIEYGPYYDTGAQYRNQARRSIGIGENGRLYQVPNGTHITYVNPVSIAPKGPQDPESLLVQAREARRTAILSRMRAWRTNADAEAERIAEQERKRSESFQRFERYRESKVEADKTMWISTLPFVEAGKGIKSSRRWGIEVETGAGRDLSGIPSQWDSKGDGSLESAYGPRYIDPEDCPYYASSHMEEEYVMALQEERFKNSDTGEYETREVEVEVDNEDYRDPYYCDYCGDVEDSGDYYDDDDCVELVSPILSSMHSKGLRQICNDIENSPRTDSAGVHVHVEAKDLSVAQIKELVMGYDHIERFLESSYDRRERGYCKRRSARELMQVIRQPHEGIDPRSMKTGDRYVTVNLQALYSHGTIEFRAMGPKYNYDHLIRWAMFCREMLNVFANGATSKHFARAKSWNDVLAIFAKFGSEYNFATVGQMESSVEFEDIEATV